VTKALVSAVVVATLVAVGGPQAHAQAALDRTKVLRAAADALGMERWSDVGTGDTRLPGIDIVNTMDMQGTGMVDAGGQMVKTEYHLAIGYNPAGLRIDMTRAGQNGGAAQHVIQTVRDEYAWDDSTLGAGLVPGKGTSTPVSGAVKERLLQLWTLPFGVVKAALSAGAKATVASEGGSTVITFPLSGQLAGVTVKATLDANNFVTRVDTTGPANLTTTTEYANYADRAEVLTDIKTPGHIVRRQGGRTILDIDVKTWETNNPYVVFPVPPAIRTAAR
jgi:hypothetical protein